MISDEQNIVQLVETAPQSYNSILQEMHTHGTCQVILRKKVNRLLKEQRLWRLKIPGTRSGLSLLVAPEREYKILVVQGLKGVKIFYLLDYKMDEKFLVIENFWELENKTWTKWVYKNEVMRIPKYSLRGEMYRLWE